MVGSSVLARALRSNRGRTSASDSPASSVSRNRIGEIGPDVEEGSFLHRLDVLVGGEIELDLARLRGAEWADIRDGRFVISSELKMGEPHMVSSGLEHLAESAGSGLCAAVDDGEVQVGGVAVVGEVDETDGGATLEDEPATVVRSGVAKLRDDMGEDVVPLHDGGVDAVGVRSTGEGVAGEHG